MGGPLCRGKAFGSADLGSRVCLFVCLALTHTELHNNWPLSLKDKTRSSGDPKQHLSRHNPGFHSKSSNNCISSDCLAAEQQGLAKVGYSKPILEILLSDLWASTNRIYKTAWRVYVRCCSQNQVQPEKTRIRDLLECLHSDKVLNIATPRRQISTISSMLCVPKGHHCPLIPIVRKFLRGETLLNLCPGYPLLSLAWSFKL